jgi:hypothetical protein
LCTVEHYRLVSDTANKGGKYLVLNVCIYTKFTPFNKNALSNIRKGILVEPEEGENI